MEALWRDGLGESFQAFHLYLLFGKNGSRRETIGYLADRAEHGLSFHAPSTDIKTVSPPEVPARRTGKMVSFDTPTTLFSTCDLHDLSTCSNHRIQYAVLESRLSCSFVARRPRPWKTPRIIAAQANERVDRPEQKVGVKLRPCVGRVSDRRAQIPYHSRAPQTDAPSRGATVGRSYAVHS
jgi:hypothetical protein